MTDHENRKGALWYCLAGLSVLGLACSVPLLFPGVRNIIIEGAEI